MSYIELKDAISWMIPVSFTMLIFAVIGYFTGLTCVYLYGAFATVICMTMVETTIVFNWDVVKKHFINEYYYN